MGCLAHCDTSLLVFTRPTSMSYGANTPPLSILDDYSSFPEGSQSSIDLSHVNYVLSNMLTLFRTLPRAKSNHTLATTVTNDRSLNKYYVLCDDAQDTMTESRFRSLRFDHFIL